MGLVQLLFSCSDLDLKNLGSLCIFSFFSGGVALLGSWLSLWDHGELVEVESVV